jgi:hypothetical protein
MKTLPSFFLLLCLLLINGCGSIREKIDLQGMERHDSLVISITHIDSVQSWASPLWGHHLPKIGVSSTGRRYVAKYSGTYPNSDIDVLARYEDNEWELQQHFSNAYQPSLLLVDEEDRINIIQNSQTDPMMHLRSIDSAHPMSFDTVALGNGQPDGRGWYVGAGIVRDKIFMGYVTLSYDLFLTWKNINDRKWNEPILIHRGIVDTVVGNHSWTRPKFAFFGEDGYFIVNETSDGSLRNTYNAVVLVQFSQKNPAHFTTEYIDKVPKGYTAFSTDFSISPNGMLVCAYSIGPKRYDAGNNDNPPKQGLYMALKNNADTAWNRKRVITQPGEGSIIFAPQQSVIVVQVHSKKKTATSNNDFDTVRMCWEAHRTDDTGMLWKEIVVAGATNEFMNPSHLQFAPPDSRTPGFAVGLFQDYFPPVLDNNMRLYRLYEVQAELKKGIQ